MTDLPKRSGSQEIGVSAAGLLDAALSKPCTVIPVPQERDLGVDFICEVMQDEYPTGKLFNVQCKGTEDAEVKVKGDLIKISIKVTTLNYWLILPNPTFLVIVDRKNKLFYWSYPQDFLSSLNKDWKKQKTVLIDVPTENHFNQDISTLPSQLISIVNSQSFATPQSGDYIGTLSLAKALNKASDYELSILRAPFHRPFQYMGMPISEVAKIVKSEPNKAGNIFVESDQAWMQLIAEGNFIHWIEVSLKKTAPCNQRQPFNSEVMLGVLSLNPSELELARQQTHSHSYYDHKRRLKISVACVCDDEPLSVQFSGKYYKA